MHNRKDNYLIKFRKGVQIILKEKVILNTTEEWQIEELFNDIYEDGFVDGIEDEKRIRANAL